MDNPGLPPALWAALDKRLWHATGVRALQGILGDGEIRVLADRYNNSLCKTLGAVSLMDFGPTCVDVPYQFNNWAGWFGCQQGCRVAVWLEIDRNAVVTNLVDAGTARCLWRQNLSRKIIPGVEACHRGAIPIGAILLALLIDRYNHEAFQQHPMAGDAIGALLARFEEELPPPPLENPFFKAIRAANKRRIPRGEAPPGGE